MHTVMLWTSLVLACTITYPLIAVCQYVGSFPSEHQQDLVSLQQQNQLHQQYLQQQQQQQQQQQEQQQLQPLQPQANQAETHELDVYNSNGEKRAATVAEPTCEELRTMWRYSKRQSRAVEGSNELPLYKDPFNYNIWVADNARQRSSAEYQDEYQGTPRSRGAGGMPVYGKLVHKAPAGSRLRNGMPHKAFEELSSYYGTVSRHAPAASPAGGKGRMFRHGASDSAPQAGKFNELKQYVISERAQDLENPTEIDGFQRVKRSLNDGYSEKSTGKQPRKFEQAVVKPLFENLRKLALLEPSQFPGDKTQYENVKEVFLQLQEQIQRDFPSLLNDDEKLQYDISTGQLKPIIPYPKFEKIPHLDPIRIAEADQNQRRAEEMASRAAVFKEIDNRRQNSDQSVDSRNTNFLSALQAYEDPKAYNAKFAPESDDFDQSVVKANRYRREFALR